MFTTVIAASVMVSMTGPKIEVKDLDLKFMFISISSRTSSSFFVLGRGGGGWRFEAGSSSARGACSRAGLLGDLSLPDGTVTAAPTAVPV